MNSQNALRDPFKDLALNAETFSLTFDSQVGWSSPFPDVDSSQTLIVVFSANDFWNDRAPLTELDSAFPLSSIVGCSAHGTMCDGKLLDGAVSVGIIKFQSTDIQLASVELTEDSKLAGVQLAEKLKHPNLKGVILFSDGLTTEGTELVRGIQTVLPEGIPIAGALASDAVMEHTWVNVNGELKSDTVCAVGLIGDKVELVCASGGGWELMSNKHVANRTSHQTIFEIDGRPACEVYAEMVGIEALENLPWSTGPYPITLNLDGSDVVRTVIGCDMNEGWLKLAGDVPEGVEVQFMKSNLDGILDGVDEAAQQIHMKTVALTENSLAIGISCAARRAILIERAGEEAGMLQSSIGSNVCHVGMYSFGEISTTTCGRPQVHNQTMTIAVIREH